jgi:Family of unknown function (DUF5641)
MIRRKWTRLKWKLTLKEVAVMDGPCLVLGHWPKGVIEEVLPKSDEVVRTVDINMAKEVSAMWSRHGVENVAAVPNP